MSKNRISQLIRQASKLSASVENDISHEIPAGTDTTEVVETPAQPDIIDPTAEATEVKDQAPIEIANEDEGKADRIAALRAELAELEQGDAAATPVAELPAETVVVEEPAADAAAADVVADEPVVAVSTEEGEQVEEFVPVADNEGTEEIVEVVQTERELADAEDTIGDLVEAQEALEEIAEDVEESLDEGGLTPRAAEMTERAVDAYTDRVLPEGEGQEAPAALPAMESFGGMTSRIHATRMSLEAIGDRIEQVKEMIRKAVAFVRDLLKRLWAFLTDATARMRSRAEALLKVKLGNELKSNTVSMGNAGKLVLVEGKPDAEGLSDTGRLLDEVMTFDVAAAPGVKAILAFYSSIAQNGKIVEAGEASAEEILKALQLDDVDGMYKTLAPAFPKGFGNLREEGLFSIMSTEELPGGVRVGFYGANPAAVEAEVEKIMATDAKGYEKVMKIVGVWARTTSRANRFIVDQDDVEAPESLPVLRGDQIRQIANQAISLCDRIKRARSKPIDPPSVPDVRVPENAGLKHKALVAVAGRMVAGSVSGTNNGIAKFGSQALRVTNAYLTWAEKSAAAYGTK